jgi:hypothetical protein
MAWSWGFEDKDIHYDASIKYKIREYKAWRMAGWYYKKA